MQVISLQVTYRNSVRFAHRCRLLRAYGDCLSFYMDRHFARTRACSAWRFG